MSSDSKVPSHHSSPRSGASFGWSRGGDDHAFDTGEAERYDDAGVLGRGGMGEVRAVHDRRLGREVALKVLRAQGPEHEARLAREAGITARLEHPGIVPVYGAGRTDDGALFYTMRLVRGRSLAQALREADGLAGRLRFVRHLLDACEAVAYAASQGVVHRDLKPANVMIGRFGETQVVDWGLAAVLRGPLEGTGPVGRVGTPRYASPQQAAGEPADPRDDVFALGGILFEMLTGRAPRLGDGFVAERSVASVRSVEPEAPPELAAIADRALAFEPDARYADAVALALDLEAWFAGRRVEAYDYSPRELVHRLVKAWRVPLAITAVAVAAVCVVAVAAFLRTTHERDRADTARQAAESAQADAAANFSRALAAQAVAAAEDGRRAEAEILAASALMVDERPEARGVFSRYGLEPRPRSLGAWSLPPCAKLWVARSGLRAACLTETGAVELDLEARTAEPETRLDRTIVAAHARSVGGLVLGADEHRIVVASPGEGARVVTDEASTVEGLVEGHTPDHYLAFGRGRAGIFNLAEGTYVAANPCGGRLQLRADLADGVVAVTCSDGAIRINSYERARSGLPFRTLVALGTQAVAIHIDRTGTGRVLLGLVDGRAVVVAPDGEVLTEVDAGPDAAQDVFLLDDRFAVTGGRGGVSVWTLDARLVARLPSEPASVRLLARDHVRVIGGGEVEDWRLPDPGRVTTFRYPEGLSSIDLDPTGERVLTGHGDAYARIRRLSDGVLEAALTWQPAVVKDVAFSPDGSRVAAVGMRDDAVRVFDGPDWVPSARLQGGRHRRVLWLGQDRVVGLPYDRDPRLWEAREGATQRRIRGASWPHFDAETTASGALWLLDGLGGVWHLPNSADPRLRRVGSVAAAGAIAGTDDYALVAAGGRLRRFEATGGEGRLLCDVGPPVADVMIAPSGDVVALARIDGVIDVRSTETGERIATLQAHDTRVSALAFSDDGALLASGSWDATARIWDTAAWTASAEELVALTREAWGRGLEDVLPP